ncbi:hypothetical protein A2U01_0048970, partial [Trifolium medium]|nr:hypothetical protein [Trifolium medium]
GENNDANHVSKPVVAAV